jgi:hypothetical protein
MRRPICFPARSCRSIRAAPRLSTVSAALSGERVFPLLKEENTRLSDDLARVATEARRAEWPDTLVLRPVVLLVTLVVLVAAEWVAITPFGVSWLGDRAPIVAEWVHAVAMAIFMIWSMALYKREGFDKFWEQGLAWTTSWAMVVFCIWLIDPNFAAGSFAFKQLLVPYRWWGTMGANFSLMDCAVVFVSLGVTLDINLGCPVARAVLEATGSLIYWAKEKLES